MSEFEIIRTNVISDVNEVRLYAETLSLIADKHPEVPANLPSFRTAIGNALTNPTSVERSHRSGHGNAFVFVDATSANRNGHPLRVPVKVVDNGSGHVKTAFFAPEPPNRDVVWRRSDD